MTTAVDACSAGWANLQGYLDHIVAPSRTQFLAFVHICGIGLTYGPLPELADMRYADPERTAFVIEHFAEHCVGVKVRQGEGQVENNGVEPLRLAVQAAEWAEVPVMVHIGRGVPLPDVLELLRPRDIVTHCYQGTGDGILDGDNNLIAEALQARQQGILFDVGHGGGSFDYGIAERAVAQGFVSDVISTDLHAHSWDSPIESLPETASKLLNLGVQLASVVQQCTAAAASAIGREDELGTLNTGTVADLAALIFWRASSSLRMCAAASKRVGKNWSPPSPCATAHPTIRPICMPKWTRTASARFSTKNSTAKTSKRWDGTRDERGKNAGAILPVVLDSRL